MRSLWNLCRGALLIVGFGLSAGCATDPVPKKKVDDDSLSKQARQMRANSNEFQGTGLDPRARAIEKDLGGTD
jgi:outer membrane biogenesis lipoprotein LolB